MPGVWGYYPVSTCCGSTIYILYARSVGVLPSTHVLWLIYIYYIPGVWGDYPLPSTHVLWLNYIYIIYQECGCTTHLPSTHVLWLNYTVYILYQECGGTTHVLRLNWSPDGQYIVTAHAMNGGGPTAKVRYFLSFTCIRVFHFQSFFLRCFFTVIF